MKSKKTLQKLQNGKGIFQSIANKVFSGNKLHGSEKHHPYLDFSLQKGFQIKNGQFSGPQTHFVQRIKGNMQINPENGKLEDYGDNSLKVLPKHQKIANSHDIRYSLATNYDDVRKADEKMKQSLKKTMSIFHPIDTINAIVPYIGILGKNTLEDLNFVKKDQFTDNGDFQKLSQEDQNIVKNRLKELEYEGYTGKKFSKKQTKKQTKRKTKK